MLQTEIELLKAHNHRLLNFPPLSKVIRIPNIHIHEMMLVVKKTIF